MKYFVLGGVLVGLLPLRHRPRLRRHRLDQLRRHPQLLRPAVHGLPASSPAATCHPRRPDARRPRPAARRARFKVAAVPFHSWSPDVYDGAPTPAVAFMAAAVKAAAFAALVRVFVVTLPQLRHRLAADRRVLAVLSLLVGSVLAIVQTNVKRMLAYSSISHAGFILVAVAGRQPPTAPRRCCSTWSPTPSWWPGSSPWSAWSSGRGRRPHVARRTTAAWPAPTRACRWPLTMFLLAQAGVPFTTGFFAKFYVGDAAAVGVQADVAGRHGHGRRRHRRLLLPAGHRGHVHERTRPTRARHRAASGCRWGPSWPSVLCLVVTVGVGHRPQRVRQPRPVRRPLPGRAAGAHAAAAGSDTDLGSAHRSRARSRAANVRAHRRRAPLAAGGLITPTPPPDRRS